MIMIEEISVLFGMADPVGFDAATQWGRGNLDSIERKLTAL